MVRETVLPAALIQTDRFDLHLDGSTSAVWSCALIKNSETDDFVGCIGTVRVLFMG